MRSTALVIATSLAMLAAPALAQESSTSGNSQRGDGSTSTSSSQTPPDTTVTVDTQQKLKQSLERNGFKNVLVVPEAYVIHAQAPDGSKIVMEISPDQMHAVIERSGSSSSRSSGDTGR
jgi:hypothetical protein